VGGRSLCLVRVGGVSRTKNPLARRCRIRRTIIDRHVNLPEGTVIGFDPDADRARYSVSEGGVVVVRPESMLEEPELPRSQQPTPAPKENVLVEIRVPSAARALRLIQRRSSGQRSASFNISEYRSACFSWPRAL
jgi:hypothetical protein